MRKENLKIIVILLLTVFFTSCKVQQKQFGVFRVLDDRTTVEMDGEVGRSTFKKFNRLLSHYPNITQLNIKNCDGSDDDDVNIQLAQKVHQMGINTHLMDNGIIASGGTDLFLAGIKRTKGKNTIIGVHSWGGDDIKATDFPVGDENHKFYIDYYVSIGFTQQQAEDFYYFTINSAPADDMHDMTEEEIVKYKLITE